MPEERLAFSLQLLSGAEPSPRPIAGCTRGHLRVSGRTCWRPETLSEDLRTLTCVLVEECDG